MSLFNYKRLKEQFDGNTETKDDCSDGDVGQTENEVTSSLTTSQSIRSQQSAHAQADDSNRHNGNTSPDQLAHSDVKYSALRPTRVVEEGLDTEDYGDDFGSLVQLSNNSTRRRWKCRRYQVLIFVLLSIALLLVGVFLLYFHAFFPSTHGSVVFADGKTHSQDINLIKKLGKNVVVTSCGLVRGELDRGAYVFKGIPYAVPPIGKRRWRAPESRDQDSGTCWNGVLDATQFGAKCVQPKFGDNNIVEGSEDCLFVNIWTPSLKPEKNFSVMVWLHSGDLVHGSGNMPGMSPSAELAAATNSVYVSLNYRLGVLGFLAVDALREGHDLKGFAGNYGIMDQQLALKWVKDNIRHFGGNELDITIFGHGSGATSIQALLASHWSHGLFQKAWLSSPVAILNKTLDTACVDNQKIMETTGCRSGSCLRSLSAEAVTKASPWTLDPYWTLDEMFSTPFGGQIRNDLAIFDGHIVHWSPEKKGPVGVDVSVILGTTYFELSSLLSEKTVISLTENDFNDLLVHHTSVYGTDTAIQMKRLYTSLPHLHYTSPAQFPPRPSASFAHLVGDVRNVCPLKLLASSMQYVYNSPVYMYTAEIYPSHNILLSSNETNSFVGWDMLAFFYGFDALSFKVGQGDVNFRNVMRQEIMSFVKKGKPVSPRWKTVDQNTGIIERDVAVMPSPEEYFKHCDFWDQHQFFRYSWRDS